MSPSIRKPVVAGMFYPANPQTLKSDIQNYLKKAKVCDFVPKALIAPHAGYLYSGEVAASAYVLLDKIKDKIKRVVLLGPSHRVGFHGVATTSADFYQTPLGVVSIDKEANASLEGMSQVSCFDRAHSQEHSLEVHVPFLQETLGEFSLVPLVVGDASPEDVGEVILKLWGGDETLVVISTDLSHFENYETAQKLDAKTCKAIEEFKPEDLDFHDACGRVPVSGMMCAAIKKELKITTLDLRNSGDTAGDKDRVVGYGAWALY